MSKRVTVDEVFDNPTGWMNPKIEWRGRFGVVRGFVRFKINNHIDGGFIVHDRLTLSSSGAHIETIEAAIRWATNRVEG